MIENQKIRPAKVIGPLGEPLTLDYLPPPSTKRWVVRRTLRPVDALRGQLRELEQIMVDRSPLLREQASHGPIAEVFFIRRIGTGPKDFRDDPKHRASIQFEKSGIDCV